MEILTDKNDGGLEWKGLFEQIVEWFAWKLFPDKEMHTEFNSFEFCMHMDVLFNSYLYSRDGVTLLMNQKRINGVAATVSAPISPSLNVSMLWGMIGM